MHRTRSATALASLATAIMAGVGAPAHAATGYQGRVDATGGLVAHYVPSSDAAKYGSYADGARLRLTCKVHSESVDGNDLWYLVRGSKGRWVSARYVDNVGAAPRVCGDGLQSKGTVITDRLNRREAPTLRAAKDGVLTRDDQVSVVCWVDGLREGTGDTVWYQLAGGSWVSADYISPMKRRVELCA